MTTLRRRVAATVLVAGIALVASGCTQFLIEKQVINGNPTGPYTLVGFCSGTGIPLPGFPDDDEFRNRFITVNAGGTASFSLFGSATCIFTEQNPGAAAVSIVCLNPGEFIQCDAAPGSLRVHALIGSVVRIRVTNDYTPPVTTESTAAP